MFLLVTGEDSIASRNYIASLKKSYHQKNSLIKEIEASELTEIIKNETDVNLFGEPTIYFTQGLLVYWSKLKKKHAVEMKALIDNPIIKVINWEDKKSLYDLKMKPGPNIKEFKLETSIFDLQDMLAPGKKVEFVKKLNRLKDTNDPFLLYSMIHKHTRLLLLLNTNQDAGRVNPYVKSKAQVLARKWETDKLKKFYYGLTKIDQSIKTSSTPFDIVQSLEILAAYYL